MDFYFGKNLYLFIIWRGTDLEVAPPAVDPLVRVPAAVLHLGGPKV